VHSGSEKRRWRSEEQRRSEENEHVSAEIERISRKTIRAGRDERLLRLERDHTHFMRIKIDRRPDTYEKSKRQKQQCCHFHERGSERGNAQKRIHSRAKVRDTEPHDDDADVVKNALEKIDEHLDSSLQRLVME
jgi:hypothetical protein